jgi:type III secretory pathway component EscT
VDIASFIEELGRHGFDAGAWLTAWARILPAALIVPAFGLPGLPAVVRALIGAVIALSVVPAVAPVDVSAGALPARLALEALAGLPAALTAAAALWAASMAGGLVDELRGHFATGDDGNGLTDSGPLGTLLGLLLAAVFLHGGGAARLARASSEQRGELVVMLERAARDLTDGLVLAVSVATPLLIVTIVLVVASAFIARAAYPTPVDAVVVPMRSVLLLVAVALVFEAMVEALAAAAGAAP